MQLAPPISNVKNVGLGRRAKLVRIRVLLKGANRGIAISQVRERRRQRCFVHIAYSSTRFVQLVRYDSLK